MDITVVNISANKTCVITWRSRYKGMLLCILLWACTPCIAGISNKQFEFDSSMLVGAAKDSTTLDRFSRAGTVEPGTYQVDIFINASFFSRQTLPFNEVSDGNILPCFSAAFLIAAGVLPEKIKSYGISEQCLPLEQQVIGASTRFDISRLRLDMFVPQADMKRVARGLIPESDLSSGNSMLFTSYDANYYHSQSSGYSMGATYLGMNSGLNVGLWQLRQQSSYTHYSSDMANYNHWNSVRTYVQRPIPALNSELTLGDSFTSGSFFSSIGFRGIQLETDDRMFPESQRGYAPTIRGIATTTAKVSISQAGIQIYQTTVAPGPFVIDDLYPTTYQGDLVVEVLEANGQISSFTVPFSAVPDSMRPGRSLVSFSAGQVRNIGDSQAIFSDLSYQAGVTNSITANGGLRISDGYQALLGGAVISGEFGALGVNTVYSRANMWGEIVDGWRLGTTYSRTFVPTATTLALAGYRYSTQGYRDLNDVLGLRSAQENQRFWQSSTFEQRSLFSATLGQGLGDWGQLYLSGATSDYRSGRGRETQYQLAYSHHYGMFNYNVSVSRQQTGSTRYGVISDKERNSQASSQNMVMVSLSVPLGVGARSPILSSGVTQSSGENGYTSYQTTLSGTLGEDQTLSYSLNGEHDSNGNGTSGGGSLTQQWPVATVGASLSKGRNYTQVGSSARGGIVAHSGGVTLGPYLGDTFALVQASGAEGAQVINGMGARIDAFGYAIVPSIVPYSYNDISLDAKGIDNPNTELTENQQRTAPYSGATVKLNFNTAEGYPMLLKLTAGHPPLPLGTNVYDQRGTVVGLVGQGGQLYARVAKMQGVLHVKWGENRREQCSVHYDLMGIKLSQSLYLLEQTCIVDDLPNHNG